MNNPLFNTPTDGGYYFVKFLLDECADELERLDQADINAIAKVVRAKSDRNIFVNERDNPLKDIAKLPEPRPKKKAPAKKKKK